MALNPGGDNCFCNYTLTQINVKLWKRFIMRQLAAAMNNKTEAFCQALLEGLSSGVRLAVQVLV